MNLLHAVALRLVFIKSYQTLFIKLRKKNEKRGKSCLISFCSCTKSDLFLTSLASVMSPCVALSVL